MWVCYFELDCIYFAVLIVKILEHDGIYFVLSFGIVQYVENLSRSVYCCWNLYTKLFTIISLSLTYKMELPCFQSSS